MEEIAREFLRSARHYLRDDYLPKIERCLGELTDEQLWWRSHDNSNSVANLLLHLEGNARQWILGGLRGDADGRRRQEEFDARGRLSRAELLGRLRETLSEIDGVLASLAPAALLERRRIQGHDVTVLGAVFHVVEHFSTHTGQIVLLTKALTGGDLRFYDTSGGDPRPTWRTPRAAEP
jgi:uncharacterized damage-inducible protein DinB